MQIDPRYAHMLPPEGMTFRELWQDRFAGWAKIDEYEYRTGKSKSTDACRFTQLFVSPARSNFRSRARSAGRSFSSRISTGKSDSHQMDHRSRQPESGGRAVVAI